MLFIGDAASRVSSAARERRSKRRRCSTLHEASRSGLCERKPLRKNVWEDGVLKCAREFTEMDRKWRIQDFWQVLQHRLSCATHVVLSETFALLTGAPLPAGLRRIAEACPQGVRTYVSFLQAEAGYEIRLRRSLWRHIHSNGSTVAKWEVVTPAWTRQSVLPPPKEFRGPVGAYSYYKYHNNRCLYLRWTRRLLLLQAVETYYLQNQHPSFVCPNAGCELRFELPGQWTAHAIDARHDLDIVPPSEQLRTLFAQHDARLAHMKKQRADTLMRMRTAWGEQGTPQREGAEHAFLYQLQHDPLYSYEKPAKESSIFGTTIS